MVYRLDWGDGAQLPSPAASTYRDIEAHWNVAAGRVGVRTHRVGGLDQLVRCLLLHVGQFDMQGDVQPESTLRRLLGPASTTTAESEVCVFRRAATASSAERKQEAQPAAHSCSGLVAPPGPPLSFGIREVERAPGLPP